MTLDAGALIALDRGNKRMIALLREALAQRRTFRVPSGVVAQAWREGRTQATLARFLRTDEVQIVPLNDQVARSCGELCRAAGTADHQGLITPLCLDSVDEPVVSRVCDITRPKQVRNPQVAASIK